MKSLTNIYNFVLAQLPSRPDGQAGETFSYEDYRKGLRTSPPGSAPGGEKCRQDFLKAMLAADPQFGEKVAGFHSYQAHGLTGNCEMEYAVTRPEDRWCRVLYMLPRWLLWQRVNREKPIQASEVLERCGLFREGKWKTLHEQCQQASTEDVEELFCMEIDDGEYTFYASAQKDLEALENQEQYKIDTKKDTDKDEEEEGKGGGGEGREGGGSRDAEGEEEEGEDTDKDEDEDEEGEGGGGEGGGGGGEGVRGGI